MKVTIDLFQIDGDTGKSLEFYLKEPAKTQLTELIEGLLEEDEGFLEFLEEHVKENHFPEWIVK